MKDLISEVVYVSGLPLYEHFPYVSIHQATNFPESHHPLKYIPFFINQKHFQ